MSAVRLLLARVLTALVFCAVADRSSQAESRPTRPITLVIGFAGGTIGRPFFEFASKQLGQPVVVENCPAGGGIVAAIGLQAVGPMVLRAIMDPSVGFDSEKDFSPMCC